MIFFVDGIIGLNILKFLIKNFKKDIQAIVLTKSDILIKNYLKKKLHKSKIITWEKSNNFQKKLISINPNKFFLLWWPLILKKNLLKIPKYGTINTHPSYLPHYKGRDPNFWSILNNGPYGVTIHKASIKIDSGNILFQKKINKIDYTIDGQKLYKINAVEIVKLFKNKYKILRKNNFTKFKMNKKSKIKKRNDMIKECEITLNKSYKAEYLINLMRAKNFPPNNGVTFKKKGKIYSINIKIKKIK
tara:strand:- start:902 stop:1639 length:738 start_codon:yes stop_codon:yes gene_type:complete